jgi:hypothetical protein
MYGDDSAVLQGHNCWQTQKDAMSEDSRNGNVQETTLQSVEVVVIKITGWLPESGGHWAWVVVGVKITPERC